MTDDRQRQTTWDTEDVEAPGFEEFVWDGLSVAQRETVEAMRHEDKETVKKAHAQLGHCGSASLARVLRLAGGTDAQVQFAKAWRCRICAARKVPGFINKSSGFSRPVRFNQLVAADLKQCSDTASVSYWFLAVVDVATRYSMMIGPLEDTGSPTVARAFLRSWVAWAGVPQKVVTYQGGELFGTLW